MDMVFLIGITSGTMTTISFLPQVIKTHKTKHTKDLSLGMLALFAIGVILWVVYGFLIGEIPVILANIVTFALVSYILFMKIRHG